MTFDHRSSIVRYLDEQAEAYDKDDQRSRGTVARALASNIKAGLDIVGGLSGIVSPVEIIIRDMCGKFGATGYREVVGEVQTAIVIQTRFASIWVAKKRLSWSDGRIADAFKRDRSTINHALKRAEEIRGTDPWFKKVTDDALDFDPHCENCQYPLVFA